MAASSQGYGKTLPDQVERVANLFDAHLEMISDVRELYKERAVLEREYAGKLQALSRKAAEKKSKMETSVVVGSDPTKSWDASTLRASTLNNAYTTLIASVVNIARDHVNLADAFISQVVDVLKGVERQNEGMKKKQMQFFDKLLSDRDRVYSDRLKSKQKYNDDCMQVESHRQKQGRLHDDRHSERAAKQYEQQQNDMLNSKNVYIISIAIANKAKAKFYDEDIPGLEDQFRASDHEKSLQTYLIRRFVAILNHAQGLQNAHLDACKGHLASVERAFGEVSPSKDQDLFVDHNIRPFVAPADWGFEPCGGHYDTEDMSIEPAPKVFLQNKLSRCRTKLQELAPLMDAKIREQDKLSKLFHAYDSDHSVGNIDEISDNFLDTVQQVVLFGSSKCILNAEIETIVAALGDDEGAQRPHSFKGSSFSIPTQCGYCKMSIWGLSKQGKTCKVCGLSVHSKCELKVPAECRSPPDKRQSTSVARTPSSVTRSDTRTSSRSSRSSLSSQAPTPSSFITAPPVQESFPFARILFEFSPTSPFELAVAEGESVHVIEEDDGSGWVKVADHEGGKGLVPASYIELVDTMDSEASPNTSQRGSGKHVRGIYHYDAQGPDELDVKEGELIELTGGPNGGEHYADGWWEGINAKGQKGIIPSNYVEFT